MCWNPEVSLATYLFSVIPLVVLTFYYKVISFPLFLGVHSWISMQLIEFFLWIFIENAALNMFFSAVGLAVILSQPFFFILSMDGFQYMYHVLALYIFTVLVFFSFHKVEFKTAVAGNGHLLWKWIDFPAYFAFIWVAFLAFRPFYLYFSNPAKNSIELLALLFILGGFGISYYTFLESKTWGSMWCWMANILSFRFYWMIGRLAARGGGGFL